MNFADIALHVPTFLLPRTGIDLTAWTVIACDQYTSQPEYWKRTAALVGDKPSTLNLILPEAFLGAPDEPARIEHIAASMRAYTTGGQLAPHGPGFVRIERRLSHGAVRRGLLVALDLDAYDFKAGASDLIRASEQTVVERLPPRARIRERAVVEVPHVMVLIDDPARTVIEPLFSEDLPLLYDFALMHEAGHIRGHLVADQRLLRSIADALRALAQPDAFNRKYGVRDKPVLLYAMGDGNHSFATAKVVWDRLKQTIPESARVDHPARYALVELVNVHDEGLEFGPIHRVVTNTNPSELLAEMQRFFEKLGSACSHQPYASQTAVRQATQTSATRSVHRIPYLAGRQHGLLTIDTPRAALPAGSLQAFFDAKREQGQPLDLDYIHGDDTLRSLASRDGVIGFQLPAISKHDLFRTIILDGSLPRKAFSMGEADDKRFYLECRRIVP